MNAVLARVNDQDVRLAVRLRGWLPPRWIRVWMVWATRLGDGWAWLAIAAVLAAGGAGFRQALAIAAVAAALSSTAFVFLKRRYRRRRPWEDGPHPVFDVRPPDRFSFPSGHSATAFSICTALALWAPAAAPALFLLAASVAASRVVTGLHYLSDVIVGSALGAAAGLLAFSALG